MRGSNHSATKVDVACLAMDAVRSAIGRRYNASLQIDIIIGPDGITIGGRYVDVTAILGIAVDDLHATIGAVNIERKNKETSFFFRRDVVISPSLTSHGVCPAVRHRKRPNCVISGLKKVLG